MQMVTRVDEATGTTLLWCGAADFDIIQAQKKLNRARMSIKEVREDKWAVLGQMETPEGEEATDGR